MEHTRQVVYLDDGEIADVTIGGVRTMTIDDVTVQKQIHQVTLELSQIERGLRRPSAEILQQIARALQISAETLYERAGLMGDRSAPQQVRGVREAIAADPSLSAEQRQALLNVYESFVASGR